MYSKANLTKLYIDRSLPASAIARQLRCSQSKVNYWLAKHGIKKRSISDAIYNRWNPEGDPFAVRVPKTVAEGILYGLGIGLYWGEGTKANKHSVRLANSNPFIIKKFIVFLESFYRVDRKRLRFGLQIFGDMDVSKSVQYWQRVLDVPRKQFYSVVVTPHRGVGNCRVKTNYGVLTLYFNNKKLRDIICRAIDEQSR